MREVVQRLTDSLSIGNEKLDGISERAFDKLITQDLKFKSFCRQIKELFQAVCHKAKRKLKRRFDKLISQADDNQEELNVSWLG